MTGPTERWLPARKITGFLGELTLWLPGLHRATAFVPDSSTHPETFHLLYARDVGMILSREHRLIEAVLVRRNGAPALAGCYLVDMLHAADNFSRKNISGKMDDTSSR